MLIGALLVKLCFPVIVRVMVLTIPPCFLNYFFDIHCPLCGGTHCAAALARGDIGMAWYYNPFVLIGFVYLGILYLRVAISCFARKYRPVRLLVSGSVLSRIFLIATIAFVILRNLPFYRAVFY